MIGPLTSTVSCLVGGEIVVCTCNLIVIGRSTSRWEFGTFFFRTIAGGFFGHVFVFWGTNFQLIQKIREYEHSDEYEQQRT